LYTVAVHEGVPFPAQANAEEPSMAILLQSREDDSTVFGAEAWERDIIGATAKKVKLPEQAVGILEEDPEQVKSSLTRLFASESNIGPSSTLEIAVAPSLDGAGTEDSDAQPGSSMVQGLRKRVAELEEKIKSMEIDTSSSQQPEDYDGDLPQYLFMAGIGIGAILGQSVLRRLFWS